MDLPMEVLGCIHANLVGSFDEKISNTDLRKMHLDAARFRMSCKGARDAAVFSSKKLVIILRPTTKKSKLPDMFSLLAFLKRYQLQHVTELRIIVVSIGKDSQIFTPLSLDGPFNLNFMSGLKRLYIDRSIKTSQRSYWNWQPPLMDDMPLVWVPTACALETDPLSHNLDLASIRHVGEYGFERITNSSCKEYLTALEEAWRSKGWVKVAVVIQDDEDGGQTQMNAAFVDFIDCMVSGQMKKRMRAQDFEGRWDLIPTLWDVNETAIWTHGEIEDRIRAGSFSCDGIFCGCAQYRGGYFIGGVSVGNNDLPAAGEEEEDPAEE